MLINNTKILLGIATCLSLLQSGYAMDKDKFSAHRSVAASSVRSTMSRREANLGKPITYGQPEALYHPIAGTLFKTDAFVKEWGQLNFLVQPNEGNMFLPQLPQRVRNVVLDVGMFAIVRAMQKENNEQQVNVFTVNFISFLLRDVFEKSEFNSWQGSFAKVVDDDKVAQFLEVVKSNPEQALSHAIYSEWSSLFFDVKGVLQCYNDIRRKDLEQTANGSGNNSGRVNTFGLFESLFSEIVNDRLINRRLEERLQQERAAADVAKKEADAENAKRDKTQRELDERLQRLEAQQIAEARRSAAQQQLRQQQEQSKIPCVIQ